MWQLLMAMLKAVGKTAAKGAGMAAKGAKALGKGAVDTATMKGLREEGLKGLIKQQNPTLSSLYDAFKGSAQNLKKPEIAEALASSGDSTGGNMGLAGMQTRRVQDLNAGGQALPPIPQNIPQSIIPQGNVGIGGMAPQQPSIPPQYMNLANAPQFSGNINQGMPGTLPQTTPQATPDVGFMRGMINALTGQPQPEGLSDVSQGRKTAYYAGGVIPNIIMSKLSQPSAAEATTRESQNQYYQTGSALYDPITGELTGQKIPARSTALKRETPSEQKYAKENDFTDSLKDWAGGVVDDDTAYKMMSENFPDKQKEIVQYYFLKTGRMPTR